ncbi:MAG: hypothetical protein AAFY88_10005 [Acidobacteriota bacterium]
MRIPKQSGGVDRDLNATIAQAGSVEASGFLDTLGSIAKVAVPVISSLI